ncbi:60S ribosomal protein L18, putative [Trichomonas vaginalis G3]|uniref:60S ribosomal protein L18, putative n=1 Tax=Trichomonas vaginalis (strain ATCC PRA-98 / G3) TaxID=412133 RepID=A2G2I2_TRIV3|nr:ribosomal protein family [Trichomonas vaginalis G3]EAX88640.1 60S ribosomal protein L18, putative [Trichomonas vaginalis G3]KAI5501635.1 ribosomal protein family [Trichomonas vaginalis G3]|eukprot:XP_001301570.1 60S ribosomal protein L18 [Trichomonas vaginalis G3]
MGVDLDHRVPRKQRQEPKSEDAQMRMLHNLYAFLARRTGNDFNAKIARRLCISRTNRRPYSLSRLATDLKDKEDETIAVLVAKITNDERLLEVPKMKVCALKFTETARDRILAAGGECITFDQLAQLRPTGDKCLLLEGDRTHRLVNKHFGAAPGDDNSKTRPKIASHGRKFEMARGRRASRWYHA